MVVSNDGANSTAERLGRGVVTIVRVTSRIGRVHAFQVFLRAVDTGLQRDSKAQAEQIRAVAVQLVGAKIGLVPTALMADLDDALRLHRGL